MSKKKFAKIIRILDPTINNFGSPLTTDLVSLREDNKKKQILLGKPFNRNFFFITRLSDV